MNFSPENPYGKGLTNPTVQKYQQYGLPLLAVLETIATKGQSPGTVAMGQQQVLQQAAQQRLDYEKALQEAKNQAIARQVSEAQLGEVKRKTESEKEKSAKLKSLVGELALTAAPEERDTLLKKYYQETEPAEYYQQEAKMAFEREKAGLKATEEKSKVSRELRKEKNTSSQTKDFNEIQRAWSGIETVWPPDPKNMKRAAIDQALITLYNKMLDPGSVVRESEYARTPENVSAINRFLGRMQQVKTGGAGLTDEDRWELFETASKLYNSSVNKYGDYLKTYEIDAKDENLDASKIFSKQEMGVLSGLGRINIDNILKQKPAFSTLREFPDEKSARRAGFKSGDRVIINGVSGTLD